MAGEAHILRDMDVLVAANREEITAAWVTRVCQLADSHLAKLPAKALDALATAGLDAMARLLAGEMDTGWERGLAEVSRVCSQHRCDSGEMIVAMWLLEAAVLPILRRACSPETAEFDAVRDELDAGLQLMATRLNALHNTQMRAQLHEQQARTDMMLEVIQTAASSLEIDEVIVRIRRELASVIPGSSCAFHLAEGTRFVFPGPVVNRLIVEDALFLAAIERKEPIACYDAETDPLPHKATIRRAGIKSILALPLVVQGRVLAVAFVATTDRHHRFTREEIDLAWGIANVVGLAIKNALLYCKAEQLAVLQERARLSREIHDDLAQRLGALQLMASLTGEYLSHDQVPEAAAVVTKLRTAISEAFGDLRDAIYDLRTVISPNIDFLAALRDYLADYRTHYGPEILLEAESAEEPALTGQAQVQVFRIVQEALTNVRKHARARHITIRMVRERGQVQICVEDDGQGFDPACVSTESRACFGLLAMRERAESIGGTLTVESQIGRGTRILVQCPARSREEANE